MDNQKVKTNQVRVENRHLVFCEMQNQCALCHSQLEISIESFEGNFTVREAAFCPSCKVRTRIKNHKLH